MSWDFPGTPWSCRVVWWHSQPFPRQDAGAQQPSSAELASVRCFSMSSWNDRGVWPWSWEDGAYLESRPPLSGGSRHRTPESLQAPGEVSEAPCATNRGGLTQAMPDVTGDSHHLPTALLPAVPRANPDPRDLLKPEPRRTALGPPAGPFPCAREPHPHTVDVPRDSKRARLSADKGLRSPFSASSPVARADRASRCRSSPLAA